MGERSGKHGPGATTCAVAVVVIFAIMLYFLSIGPAAALCMKTNASEATWRALEIFYAPVIWLARNTPLRGPFGAYIDWWCGIA